MEMEPSNRHQRKSRVLKVCIGILAAIAFPFLWIAVGRMESAIFGTDAVLRVSTRVMVLFFGLEHPDGLD